MPHKILKVSRARGKDRVIFQPQPGGHTVRWHLPGIREKRVFVGGDYNHLPDLRWIKNCIESADFVGVLAYECGLPQDYIKEYIYQFDMFLLEQCRYAVFEVTSPAGQLLELERALQNGSMEVWVLYKIRASDIETVPEHVSSMITTGTRNMRGYATFGELCSVVQSLLGRADPQKPTDFVDASMVELVARMRGVEEKKIKKAMEILPEVLKELGL